MHYAHHISVRDYANVATLIATWKPRGLAGVAASSGSASLHQLCTKVK